MPNTITAADRDKLRAIKSFPQLVKYLRDELHWPIDSDDFDDISFDYSPEELGIDARTAAKIQEIKQLRPLAGGQPWGIFFVKFEPKKLPVVVLRKILARLVVKKRASANKSDLAAWQMHDLLFVSNYGDEDERQITFAHFIDQNEAGDLPTLKVLGWDEKDTALHLDQVATELKQNLVWKDGENVNDWRMRWSSAFKLRPHEVITTSKQLAIRLAQLARDIRRRANAAMEYESDTGPLKTLMAGFKTALIHDLKPDTFADMYAQTIAYGLLSARVSRPAGLVADNLADMVPVTNPFLKELMQTFLNVGGRKWNDDRGKLVGIDFDELGINDVVDLLRTANMEAVLADFGNRNPTEDPVIHFYELFLKEYDAKLRMQRGVFYTPRPVVSYIVRSVHELLQTEFGLEDGLADTTTWAEMLKRHPDLKLPLRRQKNPNSPDQAEEFIDPATPFVQILDPATGTATFLVEVIEVIFNHLRAKWLKQGHMELQIPQLWNAYVPKHLLPRLYGYELMMAPYAIAHMKIGLKLFETGYRFGSGERARIYLTNALEPPQDISDTFEQMAPALAHEANAVNGVKRHQRFTVVIGNPPYSGISSNMGRWIDELLKGRITEGAPAHSYYEVAGVPLGEKKVWLQDDYVKFMRLAQLVIESTRVGVLSMITNHGYLNNPTFRGMRWHLLQTFGTITTIDLHGSAKKQQAASGTEDDPVFDIEQGVSIAIFSRFDPVPASRVATGDIWGSRDAKYAALLRSEVDVHPISPSAPFYFLSTRDETHRAEFEAGLSLPELFPEHVAGVVTARDGLVTDTEEAPLLERVGLAHDDALSLKELREAWFPGKKDGKYTAGDTRGWSVATARKRVREDRRWRERVRRILYRPFDLWFIYYCEWMVDWGRFDFMPCMEKLDNVALCASKSVEIGRGFEHVIVTKHMIQHHTVSNKEVNYLFPLFGPDRSDELVQREVNFSAGGTTFASECGFTGSVADCARAVMHLAYAQLHSPAYRTRYNELLRSEFPRIFFPRNTSLAVELSQFGADLVALHLLDSEYASASWNRARRGDDPLDRIASKLVGTIIEVEKVSFANGTVWLDKNQKCGFSGVPEAVWGFHIGGYQVCEKWLKDRKGRTLSKGDIAHYQKIVVALSETIRLMKEIDETIEKHGGWPGAFITDPKVLEDLKAKKA